MAPYCIASGALAQLDSLTHVSSPDGLVILGCVDSSSDGFLEFYNKTTAVAAFPGD
jgi:hypothetical protein